MAVLQNDNFQPVIIYDQNGNPIASVLVAGVRRLAVDASVTGGTPTPNRTAFGTNQQNVTTAGTAVQMAAQAIPDGFSVHIKAKNTNTGRIRVGNSAVNAQNVAVAYTLGPNDSIDLYITNLNLVFIDATVSGEGVEWTVET